MLNLPKIIQQTKAMKKTNLIILLVVLIGGGTYLGYLSQIGTTAEASSLTAPNALPDFTLNNINGEPKSIHKLAENKPTLYIYFNSTCHLCQDELAAISKRIAEFKEYNLIFTTVEPVEEMIGFVNGLGIKDKSYVNFLLDPRMEVASFYQIRSVPSIFVYDGKQQLVGQYVGTTEVDLLLEKLGS